MDNTAVLDNVANAPSPHLHVRQEMKVEFIEVAPRTGFIIGVVLLSAGLLFVGWKYDRIAEEFRSLKWHSTFGTIENSNFYTSTKRAKNTTTTTHHGEFSYRYSVNDKDYVETRYDAKGNMHTGLESESSKMKAHAEVGSKVKVFYEPTDPSKSLLKTGISEDTWVRITFSSFLLLVGLIVASYQWKRIKAEQGSAHQSTTRSVSKSE